MKIVPATVARVAARQALHVKKHSPAIMFGAGVTTAVTATVFACKATLRLEEVVQKREADRRTAELLLAENSADYTQDDFDRDVKIIRVRIARDIVRLYAPAVGLGVISLGLLTGAHITLTKRNAALGAAYAAVDKAYREYRERVRDELGADKDREFAFGAVEKEIVEEGEHGHEVKRIKRGKGPHSPYARIYDETLPTWSPDPMTRRAFLQSQQNYANDLLQARGHVFLNDIYDMLKMERSRAGSVVGWVKGHGDDMIDFGLFDTHDQVMIDFMNLEHNDGVIIDFNVDGVVYDLLVRKF